MKKNYAFYFPHHNSTTVLNKFRSKQKPKYKKIFTFYKNEIKNDL